ncbi:MAG TPA: molybdenum ABC transporter ATP-binding protein, partial [Vicinamibacteria bacterium]|nr:molybdenum ABC transporter ATP-binding protein [Vicinamibacteria bacterium]
MIHVTVRLPLDSFELELSLDMKEPMTALFGPSGVGKTSLLETIAGLRQPAEGEIRIDGELLFSSSKRVWLPPGLRRVGYVPQDALLFPHMSVRRNLGYGMRVDEGSIPFDAVVDALEVGHLLDRAPRTLSGGERQRVALGRALLSGPRLLLLDEPLAALDVGLKERILPYLHRVRDHHRIPALVVTHDVFEVLTLCDEVVVLERGRVAGRGAPRAVLARPGEGGEFYRGRFENLLDVRVVAQEPEEGITRVQTGAGLELVIPHRPDLLGRQELVGIFAEDVLLARKPPEGLSARNLIPGIVEAIDERGGVAMVRVATPEPIYVKLTHRAVAQLGLEARASVHLIVKTHSIHRLG